MTTLDELEDAPEFTEDELRKIREFCRGGVLKEKPPSPDYNPPQNPDAIRVIVAEAAARAVARNPPDPRFREPSNGYSVFLLVDELARMVKEARRK